MSSETQLKARLAEQENEIRRLATHVQVLESHMDTLVSELRAGRAARSHVARRL